MKHTKGKWKLCIHSDEPFTEIEKNIYSKAPEMYRLLNKLSQYGNDLYDNEEVISLLKEIES